MARRGIISRYYIVRFSKAFNKVTHQTLLLKLQIVGKGIIDWIEQWLTDRRQRVLVDGDVSNWKSVFNEDQY